MNWKTILLISAVVVFVLGFAIYFFILLKVKKMRKELNEKYYKEDYEKILKLRNDIGTLPYDLKEAFKSKTPDWDLEFIINTIYLNNYKKILVLSKNDNFVFAAIQEKVKKPIYFDVDNFDAHNWNEIVDKIPMSFHYQPIELSENQKIDAIIVYESDLSNIAIIKKYLDRLEDKGMFIINQKFQNKSDLKYALDYLKQLNLKHEVVFYKNKFLYITK